MALHIVHFIGPINHTSACAVRNLCLQAVQSGATEIELHMSSEGGNMTAGFALLCRRDRFRIMWFDLAGSLTFIGVVLSVLIEPDQMVRLFALSDQPE